MKSMRGKTAIMIALTLAVLIPTLLGTAQAEDTTDDQLLAMLYRNSVPNGYDRSPELYLIYYPDLLTSSSADTEFACSHGFPWKEDTRIPLILYGRGIRNGVIEKAPASLEDITPTLSRLLGTCPPKTSDGRVLTEALISPRRQKKQVPQ